LRLVIAVAVLLLLLPAPAQAAAKPHLAAGPGNVVVGATGASWTTLRATGLPSWVQLIDADLSGPHGAHNYVDLNLRNVPGVWEGEVAFSHVDQPGTWHVALTLIGHGRTATGPRTTFTVKRRTVFVAPSVGARTRRGLNGVLYRLLGDGHYVRYAGQKVRLYSWTGRWIHTATATTDAKGRYAFKTGTGRHQIRYAGTRIYSRSVCCAPATGDS
jgi:hypothetical protein